MTQITEVWADTGVVIERDRTPEEQEQHEVDVAAAQAAEAERVAVEAAKVAARESAMLKLAALGLNDSEVEAIVGSV
jgi:hypothetical protein